MYAPWTRTPPVAWWQLWPGDGGGNGKSPATGYPISSRHFLAVPVLTNVSIAAGAKVEGYARLVQANRIYRMFAIAMDNKPDIRITISDVASGRVLSKNASPSAFVGGFHGKNWAQFTYILGERQTLRFEFENVGVAPIVFNCAVLGQYERGVI